jgi:IS605 OrfB family transposase
MIGIDSNPDRIAIADISQDGNLISSETIVDNKIFYAKSSKRQYCLSQIVKQIIDKAIELKKPISVENLKFKHEEVSNQKKKKCGKRGRNWNRTKSSFSYRKFLTQLEYACLKNGIPFFKVNPAFTSVIGGNKYQEMYRLPIHEAAAYCIGRRALGYSEKVSLYSYPNYIVKSIISRTLEEKYGDRKFHNWSYWRVLKDKKKTVLTGLRRRMIGRRQCSTIGKADSPPISANWVKTPVVNPTT